VNAIISLAEEPEERMALRAEFVGLGLDGIIEDLKKPEGEESDSVLVEQILKYEADRSSDEQAFTSYLSTLIQYNMDWNDNKSLAMLCGALIQRVVKNDWFRRAFFEISGRMVCMQTDNKVGLAKWLLLQRIVMQLSQDKEKVVFDTKTSIDITELMASIQESDLSAPTTPSATGSSEQLEQLKYKYHRLENAFIQAREIVETIRVEKDAEIDDLKKQLQHAAQQVSYLSSSGLQEAKYEELQQRRALQRKELQEERQKLDEQRQKVNEERDQLRKVVAKLAQDGSVAGIESLVKESLSSATKQESLDVRKHKQDEDLHNQHIAVIKEWLEGLLNINLAKENLHAVLIDGTILCRAMNVLKPGSIRKFYPSPKVNMLRIENIGFFLNTCESELGFSPFQLFSATDLIDGQNMKKVLLVLIDIMKMISIKDFSEI